MDFYKFLLTSTIFWESLQLTFSSKGRSTFPCILSSATTVTVQKKKHNHCPIQSSHTSCINGLASSVKFSNLTSKNFFCLLTGTFRQKQPIRIVPSGVSVVAYKISGVFQNSAGRSLQWYRVTFLTSYNALYTLSLVVTLYLTVWGR